MVLNDSPKQLPVPLQIKRTKVTHFYYIPEKKECYLVTDNEKVYTNASSNTRLKNVFCKEYDRKEVLAVTYPEDSGCMAYISTQHGIMLVAFPVSDLEAYSHDKETIKKWINWIETQENKEWNSGIKFDEGSMYDPGEPTKCHMDWE